MSATGKIKWDQTGQRKFETGVDHGVLYPVSEDGTYPKGVAWNGLTTVTESPSGAEATPVYADNIKYLNLFSAEEYKATIEAVTYPDEWEACDGSTEVAIGATIGQQDRQGFGLCYRTLIGNDTKDTKFGYKLHLIWGCKASPSEKSHNTVNESPEAASMSWEISTTPADVTGFKVTATMEIDSTKTSAEKMAKIEEILYGKDEVTEGTPAAAVDARLPLPDEIIAILKAA